VTADPSDGDLARLARDGDRAAFRLLVERHQPAVRARARRLCANPSDVEDVMQESFLQAFLGLDRLREPDRFAGWLAGITANVARALHRRSVPVTVEGDGEWTGYEVTATVPADANTVAFGVFLAGPGRIELRAAELTTEN
jgi:DNA-directed RNA polymerase specialized sigma24 family protein